MMRKLLVIFLLISISSVFAFPPGTQDVQIPTVNGVRADLLQNITSLVERSIAGDHYPGAVILVFHHGQLIYRGVFGNRRILPDIAPMSFDTIFDLASLTKVVATTPAVMQLVERGKIDLDAPVAQYWPEFAAHGKENMTIRELLTHTTGFPPDISLPEQGEHAALKEIEKLKLAGTPGKEFVYSDLDFIVLGHVVEIITQQPFSQYVRNHIFKPLGMTDTGFLPSMQLRDRIAPTDFIDNKLRWGRVNDPSAYAMGGVAGNAGLFSTASDLNLYAQCLLNNGRIGKNGNGKYLLGPLTILKMTSPQTPIRENNIRGLGWDLDSEYSNRGELLPIGSYGHTGWTGTALWIDPSTQTSIIILTSRTHPHDNNSRQIIEDRRSIANIVAGSLTDVTPGNQNNTGKGELERAYIQPGHK